MRTQDANNENPAEGSLFWQDLNKELKDPEFHDAYTMATHEIAATFDGEAS